MARLFSSHSCFARYSQVPILRAVACVDISLSTHFADAVPGQDAIIARNCPMLSLMSEVAGAR